MVLSTFFGVRRAISQTEDYLRAGILLKEKMNEFEEQAFAAGSTGISRDAEDGNFSDAQGFRWEKTAPEKISDSSDLGSFKLTVFWGENADDESNLEVITYLKREK